MPKGELFIKTQKISEILETPYVPSDTFTSECAYRRGIVVDAANPFYGYVDAWERYGFSLSDGGVDKLMTAPSHKAPVGTKSAVKHGVSYNGATVGIIDERTVSFDAHIVAWSRAEYMYRWNLFKEEVLNKENKIITMRTCYEPKVFYRLLYQTHEQFRQWMTGGAAMFTLSFIEPHPELREVHYTLAGNVAAVVDTSAELSNDSSVYIDGDMAIVKNPAEYSNYLWGFFGGEWSDQLGEVADDGSAYQNRISGEIFGYTEPSEWKKISQYLIW